MMSLHSVTDQPGSGRADQRAVRRANLGVVLRHVASDGPLSRASIAAATGLNKTTVSSLVAELMMMGLVDETGDDERPGNVGRPAQTVRLNPDGALSLGVELHFDYLSVCCTDLSGAVRFEREHAVSNRSSDPVRVLDEIAGLALEALAAAEAQGVPAVGVTLAGPGLVDVRAGVLVSSPDLGWEHVPVVEMLGRRLRRPGLPIRADNESNLGALAELWAGAGQGLRDFIYVSSPHGVGAGIVLHGQLYRGAHGFAGELGHVTVDPEGPLCTCGNRGCLAMLVGEDALLAIAAEHAMPARSAREAARLLARHNREGDERTLGSVQRLGHWLGIGLAGAVNVLDPEALVLGGCLGELAPWLEQPLQQAFAVGTLADDACEILASRLGDAAAVRGAAALALRNVIDDPVSIKPLLDGSSWPLDDPDPQAAAVGSVRPSGR
jgi:predicted NBD/HSP70 family sugar kinase